MPKGELEDHHCGSKWLIVLMAPLTRPEVAHTLVVSITRAPWTMQMWDSSLDASSELALSALGPLCRGLMTAIGWCCARSLCRLCMFIRLMLLLLLLNPMDIFFKRWRQIITCQTVLVCLRLYGENKQEFRNVSEACAAWRVVCSIHCSEFHLG